MKAAVDTADAERRAIEQKLKECAKKTALAGYLAGLPIGLLVVVVLVLLVALLRFDIGSAANNSVLAICLASGAVGALLSVMARVTRGQQLNVRPDLGSMATLVTGGFRPIVGAVFGSVLYTLILGGLVPLAPPASLKNPELYFAGIAFLAGFSERWAQDTIVHSMPKRGLNPTGDAGGQKSAHQRAPTSTQTSAPGR